MYQPRNKYKINCLYCGKEFLTNARGKYCKPTHTPSYRKAKKLRKRLNKLRSNRIPKWQDTNELYEFIKNKPKGMVVDHIIPLKHPNVSGLHCIANLQYLTPEENSIKSNLFDYTLSNDSWKLLT